MAYGRSDYGSGRGGYQAAMVGRGRNRGGAMIGQAMADIQDAAAAGDPRAQAICDSLKACSVPEWRTRQIAPGIQAPCDDLYPLPFTSQDGSPTFVAGGVTTKILVARPQKPWRGERPVSLVTRVGATATPIVPVISGGILVGTDPQLAQVADQPLEFFDRTSFGVRMVMAPAEPGIDITVRVSLVGGTLTLTDTITVFLTIWGSTWA